MPHIQIEQNEIISSNDLVLKQIVLKVQSNVINYIMEFIMRDTDAVPYQKRVTVLDSNRSIYNIRFLMMTIHKWLG